jgi:hypothetical protein
MAKQDRRSPAFMTGWLFADMLLALLVVFIGSEVRHVHISKSIAEPTNREVVKEGVLDKEFIDITINGIDRSGVVNKDAEAIDQLFEILNSDNTYLSLVNNDRYVALVEVFTWAPAGDVGYASLTSKALCEVIGTNGPPIDFDTSCQEFHDLSAKTGDIKLRMFLVAK